MTQPHSSQLRTQKFTHIVMRVLRPTAVDTFFQQGFPGWKAQ
jgi:hypothetical protein